MKNNKIGLIMILSLSAGLTVSCVSMQDRTMSAQERQQVDIVGSVTAEFTSTNFLHLQGGIKERAYAELKRIAQEKYLWNIDIQNIVISGSFSMWNLLWGCLYFASPVILDVQHIIATGDVVMYSANAGRSTAFQQTVAGALEKAAEQILKNIPAQAKIAIVYITTQDVSTTEYIVGELEYMWVNQGYFITDRSQLDRLRSERNFQMSGEVDDATAVSIGKFAGANIIVTGSVDGEGDLRRLRLRVLDTQTTRVVGAVSEKL